MAASLSLFTDIGGRYMRLIMAAGILASLAGCQSTQDIYDQVAKDAEEQYRMVEKSGTSADKCVQAGIVAQAYLQAKNSDQYDLWKTVQGADCAVHNLEATRGF